MIPSTPYPRRSFIQPERPRAAVVTSDPAVPDLQSQFEGLLDAVWRAEDDWRFNDRLDMALATRRGSAVKAS